MNTESVDWTHSKLPHQMNNDTKLAPMFCTYVDIVNKHFDE